MLARVAHHSLATRLERHAFAACCASDARAVLGRLTFFFKKKDGDRHSVAERGVVGVVHVAKIFGAEVPKALWQARCGQRFGREADKYEKAGKFLDPVEDLTPYGVCDRCAAT